MAEPMDAAGSTMYLLQHVGTISQRQFDQALLEQLGIGTSQYRILLVLQTHPDISQKHLAANLGQTEASISRQVRVLQSKLLITVRMHPTSHRERVVSLSPKGVTVMEVAQNLFTQIASDLLKTLTERQQKNFREALAALHDMSCSPSTPRSCDHEMDLLDQQSTNAAYIRAIS
jgi:DNA-binding MarR family transcriptional regulator